MSKIFGLFGCGGFGREIIAYINDSKIDEIYFIDDSITKEKKNNISVLSREDFLSKEAQQKYFNISVADSKQRKEIVNFFLDKGIEPLQIISPTSIVSEHSQIEQGAIVCDYTIISPNTVIGKYFHLNRFSQVAHDCVIGDYVTLAPSVNCNGNVIIGDNVYIGTGAIIRNGSENRPIVIGKNSVVGMGAVVTKSVPENVTVIGNPARVLQ